MDDIWNLFKFIVGIIYGEVNINVDCVVKKYMRLARLRICRLIFSKDVINT